MINLLEPKNLERSVFAILPFLSFNPFNNKIFKNKKDFYVREKYNQLIEADISSKLRVFEFDFICEKISKEFIFENVE